MIVEYVNILAAQADLCKFPLMNGIMGGDNSKLWHSLRRRTIS